MAQLKDTVVSGSLRATDTLYAKEISLNGSQTKNTVFAAPTSANGAPGFRALDTTDIPVISITDKTSGTLTVARGGTGITTATHKNAIIAGNSTTANAAFSTIRTASGALFATGQDAAASFGTLPVAQGGTGITSTDPHKVLIGPNSGSTAAAPTWRTLVGADILAAVYPVGSIYMSTNNTSPATLFGGTWEQLKDRFLLGAGDTYTAGNTGGAATHTLTTTEIPSHTHTYDKVDSPTGGPSNNTSGEPSNNTSGGPSTNTSGGPSNNTSGEPSNNTSDGPSTNSSGKTTIQFNKGAALIGWPNGGGPLGNKTTWNNFTISHIFPDTGGEMDRTATYISTALSGTHEHDHTLSSHTHTMKKHTHSLSSHTHTLSSHTHTLSSHTHSLSSHTHTTSTTSTNSGSTGGGGAHNNMPPYLVVYMWKRTA